MTKRTRLFLAVAAAILVAGLGTGLVASYVGFQNLTIIGGDGPAELAYVPTDARFVAYANVRHIMDSGLRRKLSELEPNANTGANHFKEQTGIDLETDIDYVVAAAVEGPAASADAPMEGPPLVLARGRLDEVRIEGFIREQGGSVEDYNRSRLLVHDSIAVVFLEPGLAAIGTPTAVRKAIDTKVSRADIRGNQELMRHVREINGGDAWVVAHFDAVYGNRLPSEIAKQLPPISWFSATGDINDGLQGQVTVEARDEASAQNLQEVLRGFMALARLQVGQRPEMGELLNSLQLSAQGTSVSLSFAVPSEVIDALGALRAARPRPAPAGQEPAGPPAL